MKQLSSKNEIIDFLSNKKVARYLQKNKYGGVSVIQDENEKYNAHTVVLYPFNDEKKALVVELSEKRQDLDVMFEKEIIRCGHGYLVARSLSDVINYWNKKGIEIVKEADILHENGDFWVCENPKDYTVYRIGVTHSVADSSYEKSQDGLSIAKARCDYLARRNYKI